MDEYCSTIFRQPKIEGGAIVLFTPLPPSATALSRTLPLPFGVSGAPEAYSVIWMAELSILPVNGFFLDPNLLSEGWRFAKRLIELAEIVWRGRGLKWWAVP